jgi:small subunit ribosomal protein S3
MGTQIVLKAEKPGMVIGKGGKNIRKVTTQLEERFDLEDPQIDVQEVEEPDLNARIVADRLANALERGWYFRKAGHTTIDRIMEAGALGAEIVLSGKVTGARSRVEKFNRGYIKHNGEPAEEIVDHGQGTAVMKLGTIGVDVKIIPPNAELPDDFEIYDDVEVEDYVADVDEEGVEELLEGEPGEGEAAEGEPELGAPPEADEDAEADAEEAADEEVVEEEIVEEEVDVPDDEPEDVDIDELDEAIESEVDEDAEAEAEDLMDEMDEEDEADADEADAEEEGDDE